MIKANHDRVAVEYNLLRNSYDVHILKYEDNKRYVVTNMEVDELQPGFMTPPPAISLERDMAQSLFDDLWRAGLRPKKLDDTPAKDAHIEDLRKVAFHALGIK